MLTFEDIHRRKSQHGEPSSITPLRKICVLLQHLVAMVSSEFVIIRRRMNVACILAKTLHTREFANAMADFDATRQAFLHPF